MEPITITRNTRETQIQLSIQLNGAGQAEIHSGIGFFDHLLTLFAFHGLFDLKLECKGDLQVDEHHTVEDIGIVLGQAFRRGLPQNLNFQRYGTCLLPMDETLVQAVVDVSGRPYLVFQATFTREKVGDLPTEMVVEFFRAFVTHAQITLHLQIQYQTNTHHAIEALFKAAGRALRQALTPDPLRTGVSSTKGVL
ncbi:imidazoleglycerol-phosphate dehydratase HisB [candidate division KSB1 bacterium]|nr:imidazoleglycerol-phosphate dehydratase HisB [candidate division KSB1 bacterium]